MKLFGQLVVKLRYLILVAALLLTIPSAIGFFNTRINYDLLSYLPTDLETMKGQDILMDEFGKGAYAIFVCEGMEQKDVAVLKEKLEQVDCVDAVIWYNSLMDISMPVELLPDSVRDVFYSEDGQGTMMFIFFNTTTSADETLDAVAEIRSIAGEQCFLSSMSAVVEDLKLLMQNEMLWYVVIAGILVAIVLSLSMDSFLVPALILTDIGLSIVYNLGTNFIAGQISFITMALVAVLQMGVTMDYSIFLYSSYKEEKQTTADPKQAMADAIVATIASVTGSSLTTIAGFVALCFMSFTLGMDLGVVMAKGVVFGVIGCVTILPALILVFDKAIQKTKHRPVEIHAEKICPFILRHSKLFAVVMVILWLPALYGNDRVNVYYKLDQSLPENAGSRMASEVLEKNFNMKSMSIMLVSSDLDHIQCRNLLKEVKNVDGINFALGLDSVVGSLMPDAIVPDDAKEILNSGKWQLMMVSSEYELATDEVNNQCNVLSAIIKKYDPNGMLIGETACTKDLVEVTSHDFAVVNMVSIGAIVVLILLVLRSISLPVLLTLVIELAIYINMSLCFYTGQTIPFISSVCVGTIQLGATVDYAILMTTRYKKERLDGHTKKEATEIALSTSVHSIVSSALGFFAATIGIAVFSSADLIASICMLLARGAIISMFVVILMLPSMYMLFDGLICRTTWGMGKCLARDKIGRKEVQQ